MRPAPPVIVLFGPTAVGKSDLILSLFDGRFEVINADSMQVYRHMDIGTAKTSLEARGRIPYHLIDIIDPTGQFNAGLFVKAAEGLIPEVRSRGRVPVVCGGTAFYITSLLYGLPGAPPADPDVRARMRELERATGKKAMHEMLWRRDPIAAARIEPGDSHRILRALEIVEATGRSMFSYPWPRALREDYRFLIVGLYRDREDLYSRIDRRVEEMFAQGLIDEVKGLVRMGYGIGDPGMRGIGYREFFEMRRGCLTVEHVRELVQRDSRRFAKRQLTFFRRVPETFWHHPEDSRAISSRLDGFLANHTAPPP